MKFFAVIAFLIATSGAFADQGEIISKNINHADTYFLYKKRGPNHIHIVVTPPGKRGKPNKVLVEVYNRTKGYVSTVNFDIIFENKVGLELSSTVESVDLRPNMSGAKWIDVPKSKEKFPNILRARARAIRVYGENGKTLNVKAYLDLIKD